jgi:hypothetical protein
MAAAIQIRGFEGAPLFTKRAILHVLGNSQFYLKKILLIRLPVK